VSARSPTPVYLAVCAIYRDEAAYLREWLEFHRLVGVERFYLYDNRSADEHLEVLAPYVATGVAELTDWPIFPAQIQAYEDCLKRHRDDARWIAFIDLDEFLFSPTGRALPDVFREYERWPGVGVNWAAYGPSGHRTKPTGLVTETYLHRTTNPNVNHLIKTVVDPRRVRCFSTPGFFMYWKGPAVDENHRPITGPPYGLTDAVSFSKLRINHYATKSEAEYRRKLARGHADGTIPKRDLMTEANIARRLREFDELYDDAILQYLPALRAALAKPAGAVTQGKTGR
jgi:hypothetical protein